jgi:ABC-type molybdate transport system substrate-binding protein
MNEHAVAAQDFLEFLSGTEARTVFERAGFQALNP